MEILQSQKGPLYPPRW